MGANHGDGAGPLVALATFGLMPGIAPAAAAIGAAPYMAIRGAQDQAKAASKASKDMVDSTNQALADADKRRADQESAATQAATRDAARQRVLASASTTTGASSNVFTSPLGIPGQALNNGGGGKTLLGS